MNRGGPPISGSQPQQLDANQTPLLFGGSLDVQYHDVKVILRPTSLVTDVHLLLITMRLTEIFITDQGAYCGVITRDALKRAIYATSDKLWLS